MILKILDIINILPAVDCKKSPGPIIALVHLALVCTAACTHFVLLFVIP